VFEKWGLLYDEGEGSVFLFRRYVCCTVVLQPGGPGLYLCPPDDRVVQLYPQAPGSLFVAFYDSQDYGGGFLTRPHTGRLPLQSSSLNCCWPSPAQSSLVSCPFGTHGHIIVLSRLLRVLKWGHYLEERRGLTTTGYSPSTGEWLLALTHSLAPALSAFPGMSKLNFYVLFRLTSAFGRLTTVSALP
jgi:hypothetical protein